MSGVPPPVALAIMEKTDYYDILGVPKTATDSEITRAFRKLSLKIHPDKNKSKEAEEAFKKVGMRLFVWTVQKH